MVAINCARTQFHFGAQSRSPDTERAQQIFLPSSQLS